MREVGAILFHFMQQLSPFLRGSHRGRGGGGGTVQGPQK